MFACVYWYFCLNIYRNCQPNVINIDLYELKMLSILTFGIKLIVQTLKTILLTMEWKWVNNPSYVSNTSHATAWEFSSVSQLITKHLRSRHTQRCTQRSVASGFLCWAESFWKGETSGTQEGWVSEVTSPCWFSDPLSRSPASWREGFYKGGCVAQGAAEGEKEEKKPAMLWRIVGVRWKTPGSCFTHGPWVKRRPCPLWACL